MPLIRNYINGSWKNVLMDDNKPTLNAFEIQSRLHEYAAEYSVEKYPSEHRHHLGISIIGDDCWRKLWYGFRWVKLIQHDPRMRRLFQRGHREEKIFEDFLLWAGFSLRTINPETDKQYKLSLVNGHYGGSGDGIALIRWLEDLPVLVEFKTHNDKSFTELKAKKVKASKPQHFDQMSGYGKDFKIKHAVYVAVNKDTDEWYFEFIELDWNRATELEKKATDIIYAKLPPQKINENPSYFKCKYCDFKSVCHDGEAIEKNCRSCENASPVSDGKWSCSKFGEIPREFLPIGCDQYSAIV